MGCGGEEGQVESRMLPLAAMGVRPDDGRRPKAGKAMVGRRAARHAMQPGR
jgi:hypothetical protein